MTKPFRNPTNGKEIFCGHHPLNTFQKESLTTRGANWINPAKETDLVNTESKAGSSTNLSVHPADDRPTGI